MTYQNEALVLSLEMTAKLDGLAPAHRERAAAAAQALEIAHYKDEELNQSIRALTEIVRGQQDAGMATAESIFRRITALPKKGNTYQVHVSDLLEIMAEHGVTE